MVKTLTLLIKLFIRDIVLKITNCSIGCNIGGRMLNFLAYADDLLLLAPSWTALQKLHIMARSIDMMCNSNKTVCMVLNPKRRHNIVAELFPNFTFGINKEQLRFVQQFYIFGPYID